MSLALLLRRRPRMNVQAIVVVACACVAASTAAGCSSGDGDPSRPVEILRTIKGPPPLAPPLFGSQPSAMLGPDPRTLYITVTGSSTCPWTPVRIARLGPHSVRVDGEHDHSCTADAVADTSLIRLPTTVDTDSTLVVALTVNGDALATVRVGPSMPANDS